MTSWGRLRFSVNQTVQPFRTFLSCKTTLKKQEGIKFSGCGSALTELQEVLKHFEISFLSGPQRVLHSVKVQVNNAHFLSGPSLRLPHTAVGQISPRERRTSTTPRSPVRPWTPALLQLQL